MSLSERYKPNDVENKWYQHWLEKDYFSSTPDEREPYTIVIPPPNVTGVLHIGHLLNNTIQDILIRKARLEGKNACWVPGTDHASIATESKVVAMLREKGIKKSDLTREEFLEYAWQWKEEYGGIILEQLQKLGASCDWKRTRFTLEDSLSKAVTHVFVDLYKKGKIYRDWRMTNWDPAAQTVLSNEEVIFGDEDSKLYHVRYPIEGSDEWLTIATTRPETILGDTAVAVHPTDERYSHLKGKRVLVPLIKRYIPIIFDDYVDKEFGTGALKVTPAHDTNDYEIGKRHQLETIEILNPDGSLSEAAQLFVGLDRFEAREKIVLALEEEGYLARVEDYKNSVGRSERSKAVVEPRLMLQWWVDMKDLAATALHAVKSKEVNFFPSHFFNMYKNWLQEDNVKDWCISRQLWWGHRIPAWYYKEEVFVATTQEEALTQAQAKFGSEVQLSDLKQDDDALDTWFSSWLWPISVFDGFENQEELAYYYPTNVLVTGWDIIYFWVARMVMAGYEWSETLLGDNLKAKYPFKDVYFTGMVRDSLRRKMSKSIGNSPDSLALIKNYGADGVRFGMLSSGAAGNDIVFKAPFVDKSQTKVKNESEQCEQGLKFANKIWQALRLISSWESIDKLDDDRRSASNLLATKWINYRLYMLLQSVEQSYTSYRLSEAIMDIYNFTWGDFFSWYLEIIKPPYGEKIDTQTLADVKEVFEKIMIVLHPFMPFVTEEVYHKLKDRQANEDCIIAKYPQAEDVDNEMVEKFEQAKDIISKVREIRNKNGLKKHEPLGFFVEKTAYTQVYFSDEALSNLIKKMAVLKDVDFTESEPENSVSFLAGTSKYYVIIEKEIDVAAELGKLEEELKYQEGFLKSVEKKLSNERFVNNAPEVVVQKEHKKRDDATQRIAILKDSIAKLSNL